MEKTKAIKLLVLDVDGVLTDGKLYLDVDGERELKSFHVHDGMGLLLAKQAGMKTAFLSGRDSGAIRKRAQELHVDYVILGSKDKERDLAEVLSKTGLGFRNVCFIGDDVQDLPLLRKVGFSCAPSNAAGEVRKYADYVSEKSGGEGVARDVVEHILKSKMGLKEVTEKILAIEEELDLFGWRVAGEPFWELIRSSTQRKILGETGMYTKKMPPGRRHLGVLVSIAVHVARHSLLRNPFFAPRVDLLFFSMYRRHLQEDGRWHNPYCDPLIDRLEQEGIRCSMVERPPFGRPVPMPVKTRHLYYFDFIELCSVVARRFGMGRVRFSQQERELLDTAQERLNKEFGTRLNLQVQLVQELERTRALLPFYRILLRKAAPKAVVIVEPPGAVALIKTCKELRIPVVELQQGTSNRYNLAWSYEEEKRSAQYVPDYFLTFGDFWKNTIAFSLPRDKVKSVGFPYFEREWPRYQHREKKRQILVFSRLTFGGKLSRFALELAELLGDEWHIVYKLHPSESGVWKERYPHLVGAGLEVVVDDEKPLYLLLAESEVQVGVSSTAVHEGLEFGLRTFLFNIPGVEEMEYLVKLGYACLVDSPHDIQDALKRGPEMRQKPGEEFFRRGALERMTSMLKDIANLN